MTTAATTTTEVTTSDPRWDEVRNTAKQIAATGRMYLRGQVRLGMLLAALKKDHRANGGGQGGNRKSTGRICPLILWDDLVKQETGYSRRACDVFIDLYDATVAKLKRHKTEKLPDVASRKTALALLTEGGNLAKLTESQWELVDVTIASLTDGETQASLMIELGVLPKPKAMPTGGVRKKGGSEPVGQLAFHFFDALMSPLVNARANPDYKKFLCGLPLHVDNEHPISLISMEAEAKALLADIEDAKQIAAKPAKGRVVAPKH